MPSTCNPAAASDSPRRPADGIGFDKSSGARPKPASIKTVCLVSGISTMRQDKGTTMGGGATDRSNAKPIEPCFCTGDHLLALRRLFQ